MARIATIYHHLHAKLRLRKWSPTGVANFVFQADDQLADVIEHLPVHLQHCDDTSISNQQELQNRFPWIATQRTSLVIVLLYFRLAINRVLQVYWLEGSTNFARARAICLSSAVGVIRCATTGQEHFSRLRSWDFAMLIFSATVTLALEVRRVDDADPQLIEAIADSVQTLERVESQNNLAKEARRILDEMRLV
ncbi:uncharacterized protein M421DRAFT_74328 [Didymella exigua CBS 183.55]|uniref:Transcription factor domain-containing protein n=1 Tax=Didymella exigua CBS 183.55 TaxID=1150837 RepID=A0A6A5R7U5_9PLEO|nr:uncharacterized protein M421DRAFT_74328 [Didymella exigua CBS 183.55]KAF1923822.1 hypothetical protein M421DRAFT_74328 [Didymella exigua CBS 183.55]